MNLTVLHELLMSNMFGDMDRTRDSWVAILEEKDINAKLKRVDICNVPHDSELIKMDGAEEPHTLFLENNGQRKRCDYLLITKVNGKKILLFVEMKSNTTNHKEIVQKFRASECLWDYIESMLDRFHNCPKIFAAYEKRFIRFQTKNLAKRGTHYSSPDGKTPECMKVIPNPKSPCLESLISR